MLVGLVEVDRGTERGDRRWQEKLEAYAALFAGGSLQAATGYRNARILVVTSDARRRDQLAAFIQGNGGRRRPGSGWRSGPRSTCGIRRIPSGGMGQGTDCALSCPAGS